MTEDFNDGALEQPLKPYQPLTPEGEMRAMAKVVPVTCPKCGVEHETGQIDRKVRRMCRCPKPEITLEDWRAHMRAHPPAPEPVKSTRKKTAWEKPELWISKSRSEDL